MNEGFGERGKPDLAAEGDFRLGTLLVRPSLCRALGAQGEIRVEPRVMEVLVVLHRAQGGTVTRDQLIDACWGGRAISDDALARVIAKVRQLANGHDAPPYFLLETVPKVGYRLINGAADATPPSTTASNISASDQTSWLAQYRPRRLVAAAAGAMLALLLIGTGIWWFADQGNRSDRSEAMRLTQAARALMYERNEASVSKAEHLLREATAADPSYASAWARLGYATWFPWWWQEQREPGAKQRLKAEALAYINRALSISPDLAEAHGIMGMVLTDTSEGLPSLERAVRLDANDPEIWMWLGEARLRQSNMRGALDAFTKARALDPAWRRLDEPYLKLVFRLHGPAQAYQELDQMAGSMNDQNWPLQVRAGLEYMEGRLADSAAMAATSLRQHPQNPYWARYRLLAIATVLGDNDLQNRMLAADTRLYAGFNAVRRPDWVTERARNTPDRWWDGDFIGAQATQLIQEGNSALLVSLYARKFGSPANFLSRCPCDVLMAGPPLVIALRNVGRQAEAGRILSSVDSDFRQMERDGDSTLGDEVAHARVAALSGDVMGAKKRLRDALQRGWKGQAGEFGGDLVTDPGFASLRNDPEFAALVDTLHKAQKAETERLASVDLHGI